MYKNIKSRGNPHDKIFTPSPVAFSMIAMCDIQKNDRVLDPSYGEGVFTNNLHECKKQYCEITMGKRFWMQWKVWFDYWQPSLFVVE